MERKQVIGAFTQLGAVMQSLGKGDNFPGISIGITEIEYSDLQRVINKQFQFNGWFTKESVHQSLLALGEWLETNELEKWLANYKWNEHPKKVGIIMAGNIPLVGFHDLLCVVLSGHIAICKMSSDDKTLLPALVNTLCTFLPDLKNRIIISEGKIGEIEAVIATGSNNSMLYFEQYFGKYPHIFRKNRTSIAIIKGDETQDDFKALGEDIFSYFGLGCRNVSHLLVPENYEFSMFFQGIFEYSDVINHFKYGNNYDYNKTVYLMNQLPLLDNNFLLLRESEELHSPLAMVHYHIYKNQEELNQYLQLHEESIQVISGKDYIPFGLAQKPQLTDYADGIDTMEWLKNL